MDEKNPIFELIERYLAEELSPEEHAEVEMRVREDEAFAGAVEEQRLTHKALDVYSQLKTKERVGELYQAEMRSIRGRRRRHYSVAAGVALLIGIGLSYLIGGTRYTDQALASGYFEPFPDRITTMGGGTDSRLIAAMGAYNTGDFSRASTLFSNLPDSLANTPLVQLYSGISLYQLDEPQAAIAAFESLAASTGPYAEVARWYLALAWLKTGDEDRAGALLEQIVEEGAYQSENSAALLKRLGHPFRQLPGID